SSVSGWSGLPNSLTDFAPSPIRRFLPHGLEQEEPDFSPRGTLVGPVARPLPFNPLPGGVAVGISDRSRTNCQPSLPNSDHGIRIRHQVVRPRRMPLAGEARSGDDRASPPIRGVHEDGVANPPASRSDRGQHERRNEQAAHLYFPSRDPLQG